MRALDILGFAPVNGVDQDKVDTIYNSIVNNGFVGAPILVYGDCLITGSHRLAALQKMYDNDFDLNFECAEDVTDIIEDRVTEGMTLEEVFDNLDYLRAIFIDTRIEGYKDQIEEW